MSCAAHSYRLSETPGERNSLLTPNTIFTSCFNEKDIEHYAFAFEEELFVGEVPSSRTTF